MSILTFVRVIPAAILLLDLLLFVAVSVKTWRGRLGWFLGLMICLSRFVVFKIFGHDYLFPEFPEWLIWLWGWAYSGALVLALLSAVWWVRRGRRLLLPLAAWGIAAWGVWCGIRLPEVREVTIGSARLPAALEGYRIAQVTDLHCSTAARRWRTQAIVDRVRAGHPDLICLTGDFVDGHTDVCAEDLEPLSTLRAPDGVYAVTGNHEYSRTPNEWRQWYEDRHWRFLKNECVFPHAGLALAGVEDRVTSVSSHRPFADVVAAFAAATNGEFRVLMEHRPTNARQNFRLTRIDLQLSGHTHGGIAPLLSAAIARANDGFVRGLYALGSGWLYVSAGAGLWSGFPVRFLTPAEITFFTLRKQHEE